MSMFWNSSHMIMNVCRTLTLSDFILNFLDNDRRDRMIVGFTTTSAISAYHY